MIHAAAPPFREIHALVRGRHTFTLDFNLLKRCCSTVAGSQTENL